jgi:hypothetical protein
MFIARQWLGKQVPAEMNMHATTEELSFLCNCEVNISITIKELLGDVFCWGHPWGYITISGSYWGVAHDERPQGGSIMSGWTVNIMEKPSHRKEGEINYKRCKHSPQKRLNGGMPVGHSGWITLRREQCDMTPGGQNSRARVDIHC